MADNPSVTDTAAEKAYADAAGKVNTKPVIKAVAAQPAEPAKKAPAGKKAAAKKRPARKASAKKPGTAPAKKAAADTTAKTTTISQLKDKIMATAKNTDFTKTVADATAEMQTRFKTAYDKGTAISADVAEFQKGNLEAFVESGKVFANGVQDLGRGAFEDVKAAAETVTEDVRKVAAAKSPTELFQLQGEIARRNFDAAIAQTSKNAEAMMKLASEAFAPLSSRASVAAEKISKAA